MPANQRRIMADRMESPLRRERSLASNDANSRRHARHFARCLRQISRGSRGTRELYGATKSRKWKINWLPRISYQGAIRAPGSRGRLCWQLGDSSVERRGEGRSPMVASKTDMIKMAWNAVSKEAGEGSIYGENNSFTNSITLKWRFRQGNSVYLHGRVRAQNPFPLWLAKGSQR